MSASLVKHAGESVIHISFVDGMTNHEIINTYLDSVQMVVKEPSGQAIYRVFDVRQTQSGATKILEMIAEMTKGLVGAAIYPQTNMVIIGQTSLVNPTSIPFFNSSEAALAYINAQHLLSAA